MIAAATRPTRIRYLVIAVCTLAAILLYLERVCISVAEVYIREDVGLSGQQMGWVMGIFFWAYALGQVPSGWLADRFGPRLMMTVYLVAWSVFGISIALAVDFWTLIGARFALGLSQAGAYPTVIALLKQWVPASVRGIANSIVALGGRIGGASANLLTATLIVMFVPMDVPPTLTPGDVINSGKIPEHLSSDKPPELQSLRERVAGRLPTPLPADEQLQEALNAIIISPDLLVDNIDNAAWLSSDGSRILARPESERTSVERQRVNRLALEQALPGSVRQLHGQGWRPTLLVYGVAGVLVGALFWLLVRDRPALHPRCNQAEIDLAPRPETSRVERGKSLPLVELVTSLNMWYCSAMQFFVNFGWVFLITWFPKYLTDAYRVPIETRGVMTTLPLLLASGGMFLGGWLTDRITRSLGLRWGRAIPGGVTKIPCVVAMLALPWLGSAWQVTIALSIVAVFIDLGVPATWAFLQDVGGKHVATVVGWGNMWGNFGAGLAPVVIAWMQPKFGWDAVFFLLAGAFVFATLTGSLIDATQPLVPSQSGADE